jgi:hypothetical protein
MYGKMKQKLILICGVIFYINCKCLAQATNPIIFADVPDVSDGLYIFCVYFYLSYARHKCI